MLGMNELVSIIKESCSHAIVSVDSGVIHIRDTKDLGYLVSVYNNHYHGGIHHVTVESGIYKKTIDLTNIKDKSRAKLYLTITLMECFGDWDNLNDCCNVTDENVGDAGILVEIAYKLKKMHEEHINVVLTHSKLLVCTSESEDYLAVVYRDIKDGVEYLFICTDDVGEGLSFTRSRKEMVDSALDKINTLLAKNELYGFLKDIF